MSKKHLIRFKHVLERVPFCKSQIFLMIKNGEFPKPIKIGRNSFWLESTVNDWIDEKINQSEVA